MDLEGVNSLIKQFDNMRKMMRQMSKQGGDGMSLPGMGEDGSFDPTAAMEGGMPGGMPAMPGMGGGGGKGSRSTKSKREKRKKTKGNKKKKKKKK